MRLGGSVTVTRAELDAGARGQVVQLADGGLTIARTDLA